MIEADWTRARVRTTCDLRSYSGPQWALSVGDWSDWAYQQNGVYWFKFPNGVEFPLETIFESDAFEMFCKPAEIVWLK